MGLWHKTKSIAADLFSWGGGSTDATVAANEAGVSINARSTSGRNLSPVEAYAESIATRAACSAIANEHSACKIRLFTASGREVTGGAAFELFKYPSRSLKMSQPRFLRDLSYWLNITGELAIHLADPDSMGTPTELRLLPPPHLHVERPTTTVNSRADVIQWRYNHANGAKLYVRDDYLCFERLFNANGHSIRGSSPLVTGMLVVSTGVAAERYNKDFFDNGGIPSHMIVLPEGTPPREVEKFKRQYFAEYGTRRSNAHKTFVVAGSKDVKFQSLEEPFQDGAFMEMQARADLKVAQLYKVPAIIMGIYDKTRYDSAPEEREVYLEHTIEPEALLIGEALQTQIVDPFFQMSRYSTGKSIKDCSRGVQKAFERAEGERGRTGGLIVVVDTDTLPVKHKVIAAKTEQAKAMREAYGVSFETIETWMGVDFGERNDVRKEIFIKNDQVCISDPKLNEAILPGVKPEGGTGDTKPAADKPAEKKPASKEQVKAVTRLVRGLRKPTYDAVEKGEMWSLEEADALAGDEALKPAVRRIRHGLRHAVKGADDPVQAARRYLNQLDAEHLI